MGPKGSAGKPERNAATGSGTGKAAVFVLGPAPASPASTMATTTASDDKPQGRSLGNLALVYRAAARYPGRIAGALLFLGISSAATLAIPRGFKEVIDRGFSSGRSEEHTSELQSH